MSEYVFKNATPLGWQCPLCARIYNPTLTECPHCNQDRGNTPTTNPNPLPYAPPYSTGGTSYTILDGENLVIWFTPTAFPTTLQP